MDPKQALLDANAAFMAHDWARAAECVRAYRAWRANGGFEPRIGISRGDVVASATEYMMRRRNQSMASPAPESK